MALNIPKRKKAHARTVTNFCKEANIGESDQLDLAEFIVAARYLGTAANDDQLMNVFLDMEDAALTGQDPKALIKDLMAKVDEEYGFGDDGKVPDSDYNQDADEILAANPLDAFAEDAIWQEDQLDNFLSANQAEQNLKIARNLLATTALSRDEIAEITGVDADLLADYESDYTSSEEEETDEEDEEVKSDENDGDDKEEKAKPAKAKSVSIAAAAVADKGGPKASVAAGVTIRATDFSKSVMISKNELGVLKEIVDGGQAAVTEKSGEALKLLKKLNDAININPKGHNKRTKTLARLKLDKLDGDEKEAKFPAKYRVVIHPGALCKKGKELTSGEVCKLPIGTVVVVDEIEGRRCRVSSPHNGWLSLHAGDGRVILQRCNVKSAMMDKAIHAERARQTKVLILKSITTLNDATVTRILEKSDWNLRRAIEAFYIAKYKTQEYLNKKEKAGRAKKENTKSVEKKEKKDKSKKAAWWKSWKTFANDNS